jgi:hypothetical protein
MNPLDSFTVIATDAATGTLTVEWSASTKPALKLVRDHKIPLEADQDNWTEAELRAHFATELLASTAIPEWAKAEEAAENINRVKQVYGQL